MIIVIGGKPILPDGPLAKLIERLAYSKHADPSCETCRFCEKDPTDHPEATFSDCQAHGKGFATYSGLFVVPGHFCAAWEAK